MGNSDYLHDFDYYRLLDDFTIHEAVALIAGARPIDIKYSSYDNEHELVYYLNDTKKNDTFNICVTALTRAIEKERLVATIITDAERPRFWNMNNQDDWQPIGTIDPSKTTIEREDLRVWLRTRGFNQGFFFPENTHNDTPYLNPDNPHYPKKLAALVAAWEAADKEAQHNQNINKNPNSFVKQWLIDNADKFHLRDKNQKDTFFEELAAICNWNISGGRNPKSSPPVVNSDNRINENLIKKQSISSKLYITKPTIQSTSLDDELPF